MSISQLAYDCIKRELGIMVEKIATLQSQLTASQERERILREGLGVYADPGSWASATNLYGKAYCVWCREGMGLEVALNTLKAAEEAQMIDIESMDRDALIAEIRRLRGENKMLYQMVDDAVAMAAHGRIGLLGPDRVEHRKCPICGSAPKMQSSVDDNGEFWWASCTNPHCYASGQALDSESAAWAAWDGVGK